MNLYTFNFPKYKLNKTPADSHEGTSNHVQYYLMNTSYCWGEGGTGDSRVAGSQLLRFQYLIIRRLLC